MLAWYFSNQNSTLRYGDNRKIIIGKSHSIKEIPKLCRVGLHGSVNILDALKYAPGPMLYKVNITRHLDISRDKLCGQRREYLSGFDATELLFEFARKQTLINIEKLLPYASMEEYNLINSYLRTGIASLRSAAESKTWSAARSAAESAAESKAWSAARSAANKMLTNMIEEHLKGIENAPY